MIHQCLIVIVLYKIPLKKSAAYASLVQAINSLTPAPIVDLYVYDNSPAATLIPTSMHDRLTIHYVSNPANPGVSKAYNQAAKLASGLGKQWMLLLDQDTVLPPDALTAYQASVDRFPEISLHVPQLYVNGVLNSPCKYRLLRGSHLPFIQPGEHEVKGLNILNSGVLIKTNAFNTAGGYNEEIRLYFSDFDFFDRYKRVYPAFAVTDSRFTHFLESGNYQDIDTSLFRFGLYCEGAYQAGRQSLVKRVGYFLTVGLRSIKMAFRLRSTAFISVFLEQWIRPQS